MNFIKKKTASFYSYLEILGVKAANACMQEKPKICLLDTFGVPDCTCPEKMHFFTSLLKQENLVFTQILLSRATIKILFKNLHLFESSYKSKMAVFSERNVPARNIYPRTFSLRFCL